MGRPLRSNLASKRTHRALLSPWTATPPSVPAARRTAAATASSRRLSPSPPLRPAQVATAAEAVALLPTPTCITTTRSAAPLGFRSAGMPACTLPGSMRPRSAQHTSVCAWFAVTLHLDITMGLRPARRARRSSREPFKVSEFVQQRLCVCV